jgi:hypothetical protein
VRALAIPLALLIIAAIVVLVVIVVRGAEPEKAAEPIRWIVDTELKDGRTRVLVRHMAGERELGRQVIKEIADGAEDWDSRYHEAIAEARSRVAALNSESA